MPRITIDREAPENAGPDHRLWKEGMAMGDNLRDIASCLDNLLARAEGVDDTWTWTPEARTHVKDALQHLRVAASKGLVRADDLACPVCGDKNGDGFVCNKHRDP